MSLSREELLDIKARNETRRALRAEVSKGSWTYDSFAWIEADTRPYKDCSCILVRRRSWFDRLMRKHGTGFLDVGTTEGSQKHALQPAQKHKSGDVGSNTTLHCKRKDLTRCSLSRISVQTEIDIVEWEE